MTNKQQYTNKPIFKIALSFVAAIGVGVTLVPPALISLGGFVDPHPRVVIGLFVYCCVHLFVVCNKRSNRVCVVVDWCCEFAVGLQRRTSDNDDDDDDDDDDQ